MQGWMLSNTCRANRHWQSGAGFKKKWAVYWVKPVADEVTVPQNLAGEYEDQYYYMPYFALPLKWYVTRPDGSRATTVPREILASMGVTWNATFDGITRHYFIELQGTDITDKDGNIITIKRDIVTTDGTEGFWSKNFVMYATKRGTGHFSITCTIGRGLSSTSSFTPISVIGSGDYTVTITDNEIDIIQDRWQYTDPELELYYKKGVKVDIVPKMVAIAADWPGSAGTWASDKDEDGYGFLYVK